MRRSAGSPGNDAARATAVAATAGVVPTVRTSVARSSSQVRTGTATTIRSFSASHASSNQVMDATVQYDRGRYYPTYNAPQNWSFGFVVTAALSFLRLRFAWWPLHPVGYLMLASYPIAHLWFSTFLGWLAKTLVVRFGGSRGYLAARPFFLGLIVGESAAAGFWLVTGIVMSALNVPYRPFNIMPG